MSRAVIIGAGLGGVLAAAAMSPYVDEVVVLDRDDLPTEGPDHRRGLPQGRHAHLLMAGGLEAMEDLVPSADVKKRLLASGAREISLSSGMVVLSSEGWLRRWQRTHHTMITCTRALLDWTVRTAVVEGCGNVEIRKAQVAGLTGGARHVETAWNIAVGQDVLYPDVRGGQRTAADRVAAQYTRRLTRAATGSLTAATALWDVTGLKAGPTRLLRPGTVLATLTGPRLPRLTEPPLTPGESQVLH
ncbi:hypothetical protein ACFVJ9_52200, partial [Streptomyces sp. NPDC127574]